MKRWTIASVLLLAHFAHADPPERPVIPPTPKPVTTPARKPEPTPTPAAEHRAPTGVLYLLQDTTLPLKYGLEGLPAGTEVRFVEATGETVQVAEGDREFTMKKTQVTDDLDIAAAVRKRVAAIDAANEAYRQQQEAVLVRQQREQVEFLRAHPLATPTPTPSPKK